MQLEKVNFQNKEGQTLSGRIELPADRYPHNFALFAHCFTCTKNLSAVRNISRSLTQAGFGVLRFDFTGLGESEGEFGDTNFSGNVEDLVAAAEYLAENHQAPSLLIGHSLGGAAVIFAASQLEQVKAVATVGAPSDPVHVRHLFKSSLEEIAASGAAVVNLSGRDFTIKKHFLEDLESHALSEVAGNLGKALLVMHSPQDDTVEIKNAEEIYHAARHPKSFVSLDGADHLLMRKEDSLYVGKVIAGWASRYVDLPEPPKVSTPLDVVANLSTENGFTTQMKVGSHYMVADEPVRVGGNDFGPTPYELLSASLAACTAMTIRMYVERKGWDLQNVEVHISYDKQHSIDSEQCEDDGSKIDTFTKEIRLEGDLDEKQITRILQIADKCPVHRTLHSPTQVVTTLSE